MVGTCVKQIQTRMLNKSNWLNNIVNKERINFLIGVPHEPRCKRVDDKKKSQVEDDSVKDLKYRILNDLTSLSC